jgi:hypothetical protein
MTSTIPDDIQAMLDVYTDGTPAVPMICACGGDTQVLNWETETYVCDRCNQIYGQPEKETENE